MSGVLAKATLPFEAVVSPYHLTTREPAAMVSLQLAQRVVTLLLAPLAGRDGVEVGYCTVRREAERSPAYRRYIHSWRWAEPLFREGLITSVSGGADPVDDVRAACARLSGDGAFAPLRRYMRPEMFDDDRAYLNAASADVLKAGPDPGVSIPIAAGLDTFASARGLVVARSAPTSMAQKKESRIARRIFRVSVPAVLQGSAERLLLVRALLADERSRLAHAVTGAFEGGPVEDLRDAAADYALAFERERGEICCPPVRFDQDEVRVVVGEVSIAGVAMPADAVLRSSLLAAGGTAMIPPIDFTDGETVRSLVLHALGGR